MFFFFFQAEDGIRDYKVTGVQTCALPISCGPTKFSKSTSLRNSGNIDCCLRSCDLHLSFCCLSGGHGRALDLLVLQECLFREAGLATGLVCACQLVMQAAVFVGG